MSDYMRNRHREREEGEGFFCRFTFGQFFALLILEVFTIFFVFYLGAKYGREFLGMDVREAAVAGVEQPEGEALDSKVLTTSDPEGAKAARELMAKATTPELKDRIRRMIEGAKDERPARLPEVVTRRTEEATEERPIEIERPEAAGTMETPPAPAPERPLAARTEASPPSEEPTLSDESKTATDSSVIRVKSADNAKYSVQVGSYPTMKEATSTVEKWKSKGYSSYMMIADIPDRGRWYRVRLGGFESRSDAARYLKELQSKENIEGLIVLNEQ